VYRTEKSAFKSGSGQKKGWMDEFFFVSKDANDA
jgi:hypothetical protein